MRWWARQAAARRNTSSRHEASPPVGCCVGGSASCKACRPHHGGRQESRSRRRPADDTIHSVPSMFTRRLALPAGGQECPYCFGTAAAARARWAVSPWPLRVEDRSDDERARVEQAALFHVFSLLDVRPQTTGCGRSTASWTGKTSGRGSRPSPARSPAFGRSETADPHAAGGRLLFMLTVAPEGDAPHDACQADSTS